VSAGVVETYGVVGPGIDRREQGSRLSLGHDIGLGEQRLLPVALVRPNLALMASPSGSRFAVPVSDWRTQDAVSSEVRL
jgi:hypothetical protein